MNFFAGLDSRRAGRGLFNIAATVVLLPVVGLVPAGCTKPAIPLSAPASPATATTTFLATAANAERDKQDLMKLLGGEETKIPNPDAEQLKLLQTSQNAATQWAQVLLQKDTQTGRGAGIVIGEPIAKSAFTSEQNDFLAGCARWMQVGLGGQSALDRSPLLMQIEEARNGLGFSDLKLDARQSAAVARAVGATHAVAVQARSTPGGYSLSWQLLVAAGEPVGKPIVVAGNETAILAKLPDVAREIARRLQAVSAPIPAVGVNVDDLRFLGAQAQPKKTIHKEDALRLQKLAAREPLAGVLWMYRSGIDKDRTTLWRDVVQKTVAIAPRNPLVWAAIATMAPVQLKPHRAEFEKLVRENPHNLALALAESHVANKENNFNVQLQSAMRAVSANEKSAAAWIALSAAFADKADSIRNGRFYGQLSEEEQAVIEEYYPHQLLAALYASRLAPAAASVWRQLSGAATFNSEPQLADLAFWKAVRLNPGSLDIWDWGLEIYQPKWFEDQERMMLVARHIASKPERLTQLAILLSEALQASGFEEASVAAMRAAIARLESWAVKHPEDVYAWRELAYKYRNQNRYEDTVRAFEKWLALEPDNVIPINNLANWHAKNQRDVEKMHKLYARGVKVDPQNAVLWYNWGGYYKDYERNFDKAAPLMKKAMELDKTYTLPATALGNLYWFLKNDEKNGRKYFEIAIQRDPLDGYSQAEYAYALMRHDKVSEAKKHAQRALQLGENQHPVFKALEMKP